MLQVEGLFDKGGFGLGQGELEGACMGGGGHFFPGFLEDVDDFIGIGFGSECGEFEFEEDQADGVFEDLALRVFGEVFFEDEIAGSINGCLIEAGVGHDRLEFAGVEALEVLTPFEITGSSEGIFVTRGSPSAEVLGTCGQEKLNGGILSDLIDPGGKSSGVEEFLRDGCAVVVVCVGILGV